MPDPSAGEVGGIFAGIVALLATIGGAVKWLAGREDRSRSIREEKLKAWQAELTQREQDVDRKQAEYYEAIEARLKVVNAQNAALIGAYQLIVAELRVADPSSPALVRADELLKAAFPLDPIVPPPLAGIANQLP